MLDLETPVDRASIRAMLVANNGTHPRTIDEIDEFLDELFGKKPADRLDDVLDTAFCVWNQLKHPEIVR